MPKTSGSTGVLDLHVAYAEWSLQDAAAHQLVVCGDFMVLLWWATWCQRKTLICMCSRHLSVQKQLQDIMVAFLRSQLYNVFALLFDAAQSCM